MFSAKQLSKCHNATRTPHRAIAREPGVSVLQFQSFYTSCRTLGPKWTEEESTRLLEMRASGKPWSEIDKTFPQRSSAAVRGCYLRLAGRVNTKTSWTDEDHQRMMDLKAKGESWNTITATFPGRSVSALYTRWTRKHGGPTRKFTKWSKEEDDLLLKLKEGGGGLRDIVSSFPGRTLASLYRRYGIIGPRGKYGRLLHAGSGGFNDADRDKIFSLVDAGMKPMQIHAEHFPDSSLETVQNCIKLGRRGSEMGDKSQYRQRWSRADDKKLLRMRQKERKGFKEISEEVGRSYLSTTNRYYKITEGTVRPTIPHPKEFSPEENAKIVQLLKSKTPIKKIAAAIGRTPVAVFHKLFSNRAEMGFVRGPGTPWNERRTVANKVDKLRKQGMQWKEIHLHIPEYTLSQLTEYYYDSQKKAMESNYPKDRKPLSESELQALGDRVRRYKQDGLSWTEIGPKFKKYSLNRLKALYIEANSGKDKKYILTRPPTARRSLKEINVEEIEEYRLQGMTWKEIQAHMPDWSESTLQKAFAEGAGMRPLTKTEVRTIDKYREMGMTWKEIQMRMPDFSESRLRSAYEDAQNAKLE